MRNFQGQMNMGRRSTESRNPLHVVWTWLVSTPRYTICPVTKPYIYPSITKIVRDLHWLLVWSRLYFKIIHITYKAVTFQQPPSLWNILEIRNIPNGLRSTRAISLFLLRSQSLVRGHSTIRVTNWNIPDYDFTFLCSLDLVILFGFHACDFHVQIAMYEADHIQFSLHNS